MSDFTTGFATRADKPALIELQSAVGGGLATEQDFDHWFGDHPFGPVTVPVVRDRSGTLVGAAWIFPLRVHVDGSPVELANAANLHVSPDRRDTLAYPILSRHLGRTLADRAPAHFSLVSEPTLRRQEAADPKLVCRVPWLIRVLDAGAWADRWGRGGWRGLAAPLARLAVSALFRRTDRGPNAEVSVSRVSEIDDRFDRLWNDVRRDHPVIPDRSADLLRWRFGGQASRSYDIFLAEGEDRVLGYLVLRRYVEDGLNVACVVDQMVVRGAAGERGLRALLAATEELCRDGEVAVVSSAARAGSTENGLLRRCGFAANPLERVGRLQGLWPPPLRAALFTRDRVPPPLLRLSDWYLTALHHETI